MRHNRPGLVRPIDGAGSSLFGRRDARPFVHLHSGDTVVFSATPVPGNERAVNETIDRI